MSLTLHFHPLSSFCHKALIALYENDTPFERRIVNLMDPGDAAAFKKLWPCGQFPVLQDGAQTIPESSIIIEHLDRHHPGSSAARIEARLGRSLFLLCQRRPWSLQLDRERRNRLYVLRRLRVEPMPASAA